MNLVLDACGKKLVVVVLKQIMRHLPASQARLLLTVLTYYSTQLVIYRVDHQDTQRYKVGGC